MPVANFVEKDIARLQREVLNLVFGRDDAERNEPIHIHCRKGEAEAKYWLDVENFEAIDAYSYSMNPADRRIVRKIIFEHFDYLVAEWNRFQERKDG